jgi:hypothetical protein
MSSGTVTAELQYLKKLPLYTKEKPFQLFVPVAADAVDTRSTNLEFEAKEQTFEDIRGREDAFSLDTHGFQTGVYPTRLDSDMFGDKEAVETRYFDEVREILRDVEGGYDEVFLFDWRVGCTSCLLCFVETQQLTSVGKSCGTRPSPRSRKLFST